MPALAELESAFDDAWSDPGFRCRVPALAGRVRRSADPALDAPRLSAELGNARPAQAGGPGPHRGPQDQQRHRSGLLAVRMGKPRVIAETGAGQHGVATATAAAAWDSSARCTWARSTSNARQLNVQRMRLLGTEVVPVTSAAPAR